LTQSSEFNILIDNLKDILVPARSILDIPITYRPTEMKRYNTNLVVTARQAAGMSWSDNDTRFSFSLKLNYYLLSLNFNHSNE
jgi:hypothetical protein